MEYFTDKEILSGQISSLEQELKELRSLSPKQKEEKIIYQKPPMDFPKNYCRYTCFPKVAYVTEQDIPTITEPQSLDTTPDTRRINIMTQQNDDAVNHPSHYCEGRKYEPLDVIIDWDLNMCKGTALKYISRAGRKDKNKEIEDLKKAIFYLNREIKRLKDEMVNQTPSAPI